jgi:hypothetical protein
LVLPAATTFWLGSQIHLPCSLGTPAVRSTGPPLCIPTDHFQRPSSPAGFASCYSRQIHPPRSFRVSQSNLSLPCRFLSASFLVSPPVVYLLLLELWRLYLPGVNFGRWPMILPAITAWFRLVFLIQPICVP